MYQIRELHSKQVASKAVLVRADFNVPINEKRVISDDTKIRLTLPTIQFLQKHNCKIILCSHLQPGPKITHKDSLLPIKRRLEILLNQPISFTPGKLSLKHRQLAKKLKPTQILLLDNTRLNKQEITNTQAFSAQLAQLADVYVNDAFSASHRDHASITGVTSHLPSVAGHQFIQEFQLLSMLVTKPKRPLVTIVGGAKISTKIGAVTKLTEVSDVVLVGGGVANHFIKAEGFNTAKSYLEQTKQHDSNGNPETPVTLAEKIISSTKTEKMLLDGYIPLPKIVYPIDVIAASKLRKPSSVKQVSLTTSTNGITNNLMYLDIGPQTTRLYSHIIQQAHTVFWNGPMGVVEQPSFAQGTKKVATAIAKTPATTIVGGGDTLAAIFQFGLQNRYDYVSASGGAALEFLSGKILPGIKPLIRS